MSESLRQSTWNWLPAFLAVAETGSLAAAGRHLHVTPAAVSRTVRLLEEEIGEELFNRIGRQLVLNRRGEELREALRGAVAAVDRGLAATRANPYSGPLRVSSLGVLTDELVIPAMLEVRRAHPEIIPAHLNMRTTEAFAALIRSELDVVFHYEDVSSEGVLVEHVGSTPTSVYCGKGHPLFGKPRVSRGQLLEHAFSVPQIGDTGRTMDGWPVDINRSVGMQITTLRSNLLVARSGIFLAVLPDITAAEDLERGRLRRLSVKDLPDVQVYVARAARHAEREPSQILCRLVAQQLTEANRRARRAIQSNSRSSSR